MSPRRSKRRLDTDRASSRQAPTGGSLTDIVVDDDGQEWLVRPITGSSSTKTYRCPGCDQEIRPATPHVVAWPSDDIDDRRHWHTPCWNARGRRTARRPRHRPR